LIAVRNEGNKSPMKWIVPGILLLCIILPVSFYAITYSHPLVLGDPGLFARHKEACMRYSHELMGEFLGIFPTHGQIIHIKPAEGSAVNVVITLRSLLPPAKTTVWHADGEIPYWE